MKKGIVILLLMVYSLSSSGMTLQFHFCCGKLKNIELTPVQQKTCGHGWHADNSKCCENLAVDLKVTSDQKTEHAVQPTFKISEEAICPQAAEQAALAGVVHEASSRFFPPPDPHTSLHDLHCVYRI